jgi:hypothetical protein
VLDEEVRRGLSGHGFSTERREERRLSSKRVFSLGKRAG